MEKLSRQAVDRNAKLESYRQKKELEDQIQTLKIAMEREDVDEGIKREFYTKLLNACIADTYEELASLASEKDILAYMDVMKKNNPDALKPQKHHKPAPLKPIIITKDEFQKAVYGMGYPSMPTMTVQDFYDQQVAAGIFPDPNKPRIQTQVIQGSDADLEQQELEDIAKEQRLEQDDEEELERARNMDEFKDDHRRGYGNRYNRS
jgi:immunoglobulin-binding protein 1